MNRSAKRKAFTLVEAVVVLTILTVLSAVVIPAVVSAMRRSQLNACAEQLASHLRYARTLAMSRTTPYAEMEFLGVGSTEHSYQVCALSSGNCSSLTINSPAREKDPLDPSKDLYVIYRNPPAGRTIASECSGIRISDIFFGGGGQKFLYFDNAGVPRTDIATPLATFGYVTLLPQTGPAILVYVTPTTGNVFVETP